MRDEHDGTFRYKDRIIADRVQGHSLDVGCGKVKHGDIGLDVEEFDAVDVLVEPGEAYPFEDEVFDTVICSEVLQQLDTPEFVVSEMRRVVKPEGKLLISVPNSGNILYRLGLWKQVNNLGLPHQNHWTMASFCTFLERQELQIVWKKRSFYKKHLLLPFLATCLIVEATPA